jgi:hypothetical protein
VLQLFGLDAARPEIGFGTAKACSCFGMGLEASFQTLKRQQAAAVHIGLSFLLEDIPSILRPFLPIRDVGIA